MPRKSQATQTDNLKVLLNKIEAFCAQQNIAIFYGHVHQYMLTVSWEKSGTGDWRKFLAAFQVAESKLLLIKAERSILDKIKKEEIAAHKDVLKGNERKRFLQTVAMMERARGRLMTFTISFYHQNVLYTYREEAASLSAYQAVLPNHVQAGGVNRQDAGLGQHYTITSKRVSLEVIEQTAIKLLKHKTYLAASDRKKRRSVGLRLAEKEPIPLTTHRQSVVRRAEELFEEKILPGRMKKLISEVKKLRKADHNISKTKVVSLLKIDNPRTLDRIWEQTAATSPSIHA